MRRAQKKCAAARVSSIRLAEPPGLLRGEPLALFDRIYCCPGHIHSTKSLCGGQMCTEELYGSKGSKVSAF